MINGSMANDKWLEIHLKVCKMYKKKKKREKNKEKLEMGPQYTDVQYKALCLQGQ